jgi:hypothetical protein
MILNIAINMLTPKSASGLKIAGEINAISNRRSEKRAKTFAFFLIMCK